MRIRESFFLINIAEPHVRIGEFDNEMEAIEYIQNTEDSGIQWEIKRVFTTKFGWE